MLRSWRLFWLGLWTVFIGIIFTKNIIKYRKETLLWNIGKSILDAFVVALSAIFLPPFLIATNVSWIVSKFSNKWAKIGVGLISGIVFGVISAYAMEVLIIVGIFSVDMKTGPAEGIIKRWRETSDEEVPIAA